MRIRTHIQAFTLGELLVVMIISSIVVSISFLALSTIQKQMRGINSVFERQQRINSLERRLQMDLHNFEKSTIQNGTVVFSSLKDSISYTRMDRGIVREKDTIDLRIKNMIFYDHGVKTNSGHFDAIELSFDDTYENTGFFIFKTNDVSHYIND